MLIKKESFRKQYQEQRRWSDGEIKPILEDGTAVASKNAKRGSKRSSKVYVVNDSSQGVEESSDDDGSSMHSKSPLDKSFYRTVNEANSGVINYASWNFDVFKYSQVQLVGIMCHIVEPYLRRTMEAGKESPAVVEMLGEFFLEVSHGYESLELPHQDVVNNKTYHAFYHSVDVLQTTYAILTTYHAQEAFAFPKMDLLGLLLAAALHDIEHPGLNNTFQINTESNLAIRYNNISVLENHSAAVTIDMIKRAQLLSHLDKADWLRCKSIIIACILSTDMASHFSLVSRVENLLENSAGSVTLDVTETEKSEVHKMLCEYICHCADVSNPCKPWHLSKKWADLVIEEFFRQGDIEESMGLQKSPNMDRDTTDMTVIQMNFIDYVISPLYEQFVVILPALKSVVKQLSINRSNWSNKEALKTTPKSDSSLAISIIQSTPNARGNRRNVTHVVADKGMRPVSSVTAMKDAGEETPAIKEAEAEKVGGIINSGNAGDSTSGHLPANDDTLTVVNNADELFATPSSKVTKIDVKKVYAELRLPDHGVQLSRTMSQEFESIQKKSTLRFMSAKKAAIEKDDKLVKSDSPASRGGSVKRRGSFDVSALSKGSGSGSCKIRTRRVSMMAGEVEVRIDAGSGQLLKNQMIKSPAQRSRNAGNNQLEQIQEVTASKRRFSISVDGATGNAIVDVIDEETGENVEKLETGVEPVIKNQEGATRPLLVRKLLEPKYSKALDYVEKWLNKPYIQAMIFVFTVIALIGDDVVRAFLPKDVDTTFHWFLTIIFFVFVAEAAILALVSVGYFGGFFFWLDLLGTFSILFDVPWFLGDSENVSGDNNIEVAKAGRAAKIGARTARLVKFVRFLRLLRILRMLRFLKGFKKKAGEEEEKHNPSKIGNRLAEIISRRVVIIILLLLFLQPMLTISTVEETEIHETMLRMLTVGVSTSGTESWDSVIDSYKLQFNSYLYLNISGHVIIPEAENLTSYRSTEIFGLNYNNESFAWHDVKAMSERESAFNLILTLCVTVLLAVSAWSFTRSAQVVVVGPIERMMKIVRKVTLTLASLRKDVSNVDDFETGFLEVAITKMAGLLTVAFGDAGQKIIETNLSSGAGELNPLVAGKRIEAVFSFCDIRQFTSATEMLQQNVMVFVNFVAHIVHQSTVQYGGFPNKNIGDAFLLVWKEGSVVASNAPKDSSIDGISTENFADLALKSTAKVIMDLKEVNERRGDELYSHILAMLSHLGESAKQHAKAVRDLLSTLGEIDHLVEMGFGLHYGWAIEGAIGSSAKIDASYLSPHVNLASRLESATKQFGRPVLLSGVFFDLLTSKTQERCRKVDRVIVKGSSTPLDIYTYDLFPKRDAKAPPMTNREAKSGEFEDVFTYLEAKEYRQKFQDGVEAYITGHWLEASTVLMQCQKRMPSDFPVKVLIGYMSKFNFQTPDDWSGYRVLTSK